MKNFLENKVPLRVIASHLLSVWPILVLVILSCLLFVTNYEPGTYLIGWDVTMPELNLSLNFQRFLFGVWQEYRGLGTLDGMAHTANIVHWLIIAVLSFFLPQNLIRYAFQIGIHLAGGIGLYVLSRNIFQRVLPKSQKLPQQLASLFSAVFYMLNFMTIQMFYAPLELFSWHFAALPWGIWSLLYFLEKKTKRSLILFAFIQFVVTPQAHVPSLFIVYGIALGTILLAHLWTLQKHVQQKVLTAIIVLFVINAFWGLPYVYSALHKSAEISSSTINQLSTSDIFYRNAAWGDIRSILTFGSFNLDYFDWQNPGEPNHFMLESWRQWYFTSYFQIISIILSTLGIIGAVLFTIQSSKNRKRYLPFISIWLFALVMLGTNIPILGNISQFFRESIPFFADIFRFTFTKFSLLYVFCLSIFIGFSLLKLTSLFPKKLNSVSSLGVVITSGCIFLYSIFPAFQGNFFYPNLKQDLPQEYKDVQQFFQTQDQVGRVLVLPFQGPWGWTNNTWGHRGSGFFWQMIDQPTVDRAFDAWSKYNEEAYIQLRTALVNQDAKTFSELLHKYNIEYIFFDKSIFDPGEYQGTLLLQEIPPFLTQLSGMSLDFDENFLSIYHYSLPSSEKAFAVLALPNSPLLTDVVLPTEGNYFEKANTDDVITFPFSSLLESPLKQEIQVETSSQSIELSISKTATEDIQIPTITDTLSASSYTISAKKDGNDLLLTFTPLLPSLTDQNNGASIVPPSKEILFSTIQEQQLLLVINGQTFPIAIPFSDTSWEIGSVSIPTKNDQTNILIFSGTPLSQSDETSTYKQTEVAECWKIVDKEWFVNKTPESIQLSSKNAAACVSQAISSPQIPTLLQVQANFSALSPQHGSLCVRKINTFPCLNQHDLTRKEGQTYHIYSSTVLTQQDYSIDVRNQVDTPDTEQTVEFNNITFSKYPLIASLELNNHELLTSYQTQLNQFVNQLNQQQSDTTINFLIPIEVFNSFSDRINSNTGKIADLNCDQYQRGTTQKKILHQGFQYSSSNRGILCDTFIYPDLSSLQDYIYIISGENTGGSSLKVTLRNLLNFQTKLEVATVPFQKFTMQFPILASKNVISSPEGRGGQSLHYTLSSYGPEKNFSQIDNSYFLSLPLKWLSQISLKPKKQMNLPIKQTKSVKKIGTAFYFFEIEGQNSGIVHLSQSFDPGWIAFPSWKFWQQYEHVKYNGWANGWLIQSSDFSTQESALNSPATNNQIPITILYWPQLLSFAGYGSLMSSFGYLSWKFWQEKAKD